MTARRAIAIRRAGVWPKAHALGALGGLVALAVGLMPPPAPLFAASALRLDGAGRAALGAMAISPLARGADIGPGPSPDYSPLATRIAFAPERPFIAVRAALGDDGLAAALGRAGVAPGDAARAAVLAGQGLAPGVPLAMTLGPRPTPGAPRPLERLDLRARFDQRLTLDRVGAGFVVTPHAIPVDATPLRITGAVGADLAASARAAGAPAGAIEQYLATLAAHAPAGGLAAGDRFDLIVDYHRSLDGEAEAGGLLYGGLLRDGAPLTQMVRWGGDQFIDAAHPQAARGGAALPLDHARLTSPYGLRFHPILGYTRMHSGIDLAAPWGTPIHAVAAGIVTYAGVHGGHGNYVRLAHSGDLATGYAHMSQIAVADGAHVSAGAVIGYVGATGLATGPHLHYEVYVGGRTVDPLSVHFGYSAGIDQRTLAAVRARLARLLLVPPGAALAPLHHG